MRNPRSPRNLLAVIAVTGSLVLAGCGDDSEDGASPTGSSGAAAVEAAASPAADASDAGDGDGPRTQTGVAESLGMEGAGEALDGVPLDAKGSAIVSAAGADRYEIEGDVLHVYMPEGSRLPAGTECMVVGSVLTEGEKAVVHRADGTEIAC